MKTIFLDIDGVLNDDEFMKKAREYDERYNVFSGDLDKEKLILLRKIIHKTDSSIVLSSAWRNGINKCGKILVPNDEFTIELFKIFHYYGLEIHDITGFHPTGKRLFEIRNYLHEHPEITDYVILDDEYMPDKNLVRTDFYNKGLCMKHVNASIEILNNKVRKR